jgi:hypothetical protein
MELRNKKTGEIKSIEEIIREAFLSNDLASLKAIDAIWEEIEPKEPLIKDEKIRKAVRAWAEANNVTKVWHEGSSVGFCDGAVSIKFHELCWEEIPKGEYTITELCGEEKE